MIIFAIPAAVLAAAAVIIIRSALYAFGSAPHNGRAF